MIMDICKKNVQKYITPVIEVVDIEIDQSVLATPSGGDGSSDSLPDMPGSYW